MPARKKLLSDQSWCRWIMDVIAQIKVSRQRPTFARICQAIRKRHIFHEETITAKLKEAKKRGFIEEVFLRGELTYRLVQNVNKQNGNGRLPQKSGPDPNVLCIACLKTSLNGPNQQPEPMSSCERCGISLHDSCANKSNDHETSVALSQLVSAGNHWFCEECNSCDGCNSMDASLSRAHCCLVECAGCGRKFHLQCMVPAVSGMKKIRLPWRCAECSPHNDPNAVERCVSHLKNGIQSSPSETEANNLKITVVLNKFSEKSAKQSGTQPTEADLIDGRVEALKIKLAGQVTSDDLDIFRQVLLQRCTLQEDNLERTPAAIRFGRHEIETWYSSPFPQEYAKLKVLYICEFCLKYMKTIGELRRHQHKCLLRYPPGSEIYRDGNLSVFEVDGNSQKLYCQSLCLLARLFLDHKTLYFDVEPFLFYILTRRDNLGHHIVGYFSKEKISQLHYNVSCILTMPQYQRQGYGRFLIDFSYLLSRVERKPGTPERPLSDLGRLSYHQYWCSTILSYLYFNRYDPLTLDGMARDTGMLVDDIVTALRKLHFIKYRVKKMGCIRANRPIICIDWRLVDEHYSRLNRSAKHIKLQEMGLRWTPNLRVASISKHGGMDKRNVKEDTSSPPSVNHLSNVDELAETDSKICSPTKSGNVHREEENCTKTVAKLKSSPEDSREAKPLVGQSPVEENSRDTEYSSADDYVARTSCGRKRSRPRKYSETQFELSLSLTTGTPKTNRPMKSTSEESKDSCNTFIDRKFPFVLIERLPVCVGMLSSPPTRTGTDEEISLDSVEAFMGTPKSELQKSPSANPAHGFTPIAPFRHQSGGHDGRTESSSFGDGVSHHFDPNVCTPKSRARLLRTGSPSNNGSALSKCTKRTIVCLQDVNGGGKRRRLEWPACEGGVVERNAYDASKDGTLTPQRQVTLMEACRPTRLSGRGRPSEGSASKLNGSSVRVLPQTV